MQCRNNQGGNSRMSSAKPRDRKLAAASNTTYRLRLIPDLVARLGDAIKQGSTSMTTIKICIDFDDDRYIGHGRIQLLELIGEHGSIAKAAKAMGMSYKRAWYLMDDSALHFPTR
jgi:hypothetical protein